MSVNLMELIEVNPNVMFGKPVVKGTRIPVDMVLEKLAYGNSVAQIMESYPGINEDAISACLLYATMQIRNEHIYPIAS